MGCYEPSYKKTNRHSIKNSAPTLSPRTIAPPIVMKLMGSATPAVIIAATPATPALDKTCLSASSESMRRITRPNSSGLSAL